MEVSLAYKPHKYQKILHNDKHRYIVVVAGRRFGKSVFARHQVLLEALYNPGLYWILSPTYRQGKMIHWLELKKEVPPELIDYKNEQELSIHLVNGSRIELKGADNEDALRGVGLKGVVMDEAEDQKPHVWEDIIRPTLVDSAGWAIFIGTPKGFNWFYELWMRGNPKSPTYDADWASYQFSSYDNPYLSRKELAKAKKETDEDSFHQEYLAEFKKFKGLIYRNFDRKTHVIEPFEIPEEWEIVRGIDFGFDNPTVCLWVAVSPAEKYYVIDEYYETKQSGDYHCGIIISKSAQYRNASQTYGDPSAPQIMADWATKGVYITPARRDAATNKGEWVGHGIDLIQDLLKISVVDNEPRLQVFKGCTNILREFESYAWKEEKNEQLNNPGRPEKANDHALDALRYIIVSFKRLDNVYDDVNKGLRDKWKL